MTHYTSAGVGLCGVHYKLVPPQNAVLAVQRETCCIVYMCLPQVLLRACVCASIKGCGFTPLGLAERKQGSLMNNEAIITTADHGAPPASIQYAQTHARILSPRNFPPKASQLIRYLLKIRLVDNTQACVSGF